MIWLLLQIVDRIPVGWVIAGITATLVGEMIGIPVISMAWTFVESAVIPPVMALVDSAVQTVLDALRDSLTSL